VEAHVPASRGKWLAARFYHAQPDLCHLVAASVLPMGCLSKARLVPNFQEGRTEALLRSQIQMLA
jgi:hypothetical protein